MRPCRVNDQGPAQANHVGVAACQDGFGLGRVGDAAKTHHRHGGCPGFEFADQAHIGLARVAVVGQVHFQAAVVRTLAIGQVIHAHGCHQGLGDFACLLQRNPPRHAVVARQLHANDETGPTQFAHSVAGVGQKPQAPQRIAAIGVIALVGSGRQKLVKQMPVACRHLDAAKATGLHAQARLRGVLDKSRNLVHTHGAGHGVAQVIGQSRCAQGLVGSPRHMAAPSCVLDLADQHTVVGAHPVGQSAQITHHAVIESTQALGAVVGRDADGIGHHHGRTPFGTVHVVMQIAWVQALVGTKPG